MFASGIACSLPPLSPPGHRGGTAEGVHTKAGGQRRAGAWRSRAPQLWASLHGQLEQWGASCQVTTQ